MEICFLANAENIHTRRWIEPLIEQGHKVHVISYGENSSPIHGAVDYVDLTKIFNLRRARSFVWGVWIYRYLRVIKPAIFHVHQMPTGGLIPWIAQYHPTIVTVWGSDLLVLPWKSRFWNQFTRYTLRYIDYLTVPTGTMYDAARKLQFPADRLYLISWGIETNIFKPEPDDSIETRRRLNFPSNAQLILSPRAITPLYNHELILEAVKRLVPKFPDLHLALIRYNVDNDYENFVIRKIRQLELQTRVTWLATQKSMNDMARLYRTADLVISIPSSEGYGFTAFEALACGCPTIVNNLPVFKDELIENVHVIKIPINDLGRLTTSIERLLTDGKLRQRLVQNGKKITSSMSSVNREAKVIELYQMVSAST